MRLPELLALILTTAIAMGMSGQALALDAGQKGSFAQIEKDLAQERQVEVARAKFLLNAGDPKKQKVLCIKFTMNASGEGYILLSDSLDDSQARTEMVYGKLKNARVYDPRNIGAMPDGVSPQSNLAEMIQTGASRGGGVFIHGQSVKKSANGNEEVVGFVTIMANVSSPADSLLRDTIGVFVTSNGITTLDKITANEFKYRSASIK